MSIRKYNHKLRNKSNSCHANINIKVTYSSNLILSIAKNY